MANEEQNLSHVTHESIDEIEALKGWWNTYGDKVSILIIIVLAAIIGYQQYGRWSTRKNAEAMAAYDQARSPEALEQLINENASKKVTPLARLRLASAFFQQEKYTLAESVYEAFLKESPNHELADIAKVGLAHALEANGLVEEAATQFKAFTDTQPESFLVPMATIGLGRTLILAGRKDEGKAVLDLFITEAAGTRWADFADEILRSKDRLTVPEPTDSSDLSSFFPMEERADSVSTDAESESETTTDVDVTPEAVEATDKNDTTEAAAE